MFTYIITCQLFLFPPLSTLDCSHLRRVLALDLNVMSSRNGTTNRTTSSASTRGRHQSSQARHMHSSPGIEQRRSASPPRRGQSSPAHGRSRVRSTSPRRRSESRESSDHDQYASIHVNYIGSYRFRSNPTSSLEDYVTLGKIAGRTVEMFTPFKVILEEGYTHDPEDDDDQHTEELVLFPPCFSISPNVI